jgi:hypothetical protein
MIKMLEAIHECPLCSFPVAEAPRGSGNLACIRWICPYMTHYGWTKDNYAFVEGLWVVVRND